MLVTTEESVSAVRRRADRHNKNIAREQSSTASVKKDNEDDLTEERKPQEKEEESISEKLEEEAEDEISKKLTIRLFHSQSPVLSTSLLILRPALGPSPV